MTLQTIVVRLQLPCRNMAVNQLSHHDSRPWHAPETVQGYSDAWATAESRLGSSMAVTFPRTVVL
jgi:hypothetical protein